MMFDYYPFFTKSSGWDERINDIGLDGRGRFFWCSNVVRKVSLAAGVPYWGFVQSVDLSGKAERLSESSMRMQLFAYLAYGYTGLAYFIHDFYSSDKVPGLIDADGTPSRLHPYAVQANREVLNIGKAIRILTSTHLRAVPAGEGHKANCGAEGPAHLEARRRAERPAAVDKHRQPRPGALRSARVLPRRRRRNVLHADQPVARGRSREGPGRQYPPVLSPDVRPGRSVDSSTRSPDPANHSA